MGEVWEARDETLDRQVAVKVISLLAGGGSRGDEARARFLREARIAARLQHPTFGLPMKTDDWGETGVSDNRCTTYGRAYNTDNYDCTGAQRWTVLQDQVKHYSVGCSSAADANQDSYTSTLYDHAASIDTNNR
ncbi:hypothetical protein [Streptomyces sp. NPDC059893]|uniref:hypothetical protein n=1 Tax=Streptomyces sp. NPDC059893 TaxID=3346990 RepID=UPI003657F9F9